ncbi:hypothetical protein Cadr_000011523 [Camelus dromedarius]|uniref:Uncharacterized protein n=1 Tax=Camelus dromedarius TaxID=9838 RepID=A0A5N4DV16_CAMDR|nr:hypothetical protein Cadr_000011523 [Camelus dromedarius]
MFLLRCRDQLYPQKGGTSRGQDEEGLARRWLQCSLWLSFNWDRKESVRVKILSREHMFRMWGLARVGMLRGVKEMQVTHQSCPSTKSLQSCVNMKQ